MPNCSFRVETKGYKPVCITRMGDISCINPLCVDPEATDESCKIAVDQHRLEERCDEDRVKKDEHHGNI